MTEEEFRKKEIGLKRWETYFVKTLLIPTVAFCSVYIGLVQYKSTERQAFLTKEYDRLLQVQEDLRLARNDLSIVAEKIKKGSTKSPRGEYLLVHYKLLENPNQDVQSLMKKIYKDVSILEIQINKGIPNDELKDTASLTIYQLIDLLSSNIRELSSRIDKLALEKS